MSGGDQAAGWRQPGGDFDEWSAVCLANLDALPVSDTVGKVCKPDGGHTCPVCRDQLAWNEDAERHARLFLCRI